MQIASQAELGEWLIGRVGEWATVGGVAGTGFEAYARILHPLDGYRYDLSTTDRWGRYPIAQRRSWAWAEVAARTGKVMHPLVQWNRLTGNQTHLEFSDGWSLGQSSLGWLDPLLLAALTTHLRRNTGMADNVVLGIWAGWGGGPQRGPLLEIPGRDFVLLQGTLNELKDPDWGYTSDIGWTAGNNHPMPQLIWSADHTWIIASEIDWDSTIVAGPRTLIESILSDQTFESFEVQETDDLSSTGDRINP